LHASLSLFAALAQSTKGGLLLARMMPKYDAPSKTKFGIMMFLLQIMLQSDVLKKPLILNCILRHENYDIILPYIYILLLRDGLSMTSNFAFLRRD